MSDNLACTDLAIITTCGIIGATAVKVRKSSDEAGWIEVGGRRLAAEGLFIIGGILSSIETVVRGFFTLISHGILCLIPQSNSKDWFKETVIENLDHSTFLNLGYAFFFIACAVTNIYKDKINIDDGDDWVDFSESIGKSLGFEIDIRTW
jgi:hypothetical protein